MRELNKELNELNEIQFFWWWWFNGFRTRNDPIIMNIEE
jgi:hypothetical protein